MPIILKHARRGRRDCGTRSRTGRSCPSLGKPSTAEFWKSAQLTTSTFTEEVTRTQGQTIARTRTTSTTTMYHKIVVSSDGKYPYGYVTLELELSAGKMVSRCKQLDDRVVRHSQLEWNERVECTLGRKFWLRKPAGIILQRMAEKIMTRSVTVARLSATCSWKKCSTMHGNCRKSCDYNCNWSGFAWAAKTWLWIFLTGAMVPSATMIIIHNYRSILYTLNKILVNINLYNFARWMRNLWAGPE